MAEKKKEHLSNRDKYGSDFTCPDCGRTAAEDDVYDAGNGFCVDCAPNH